MWRWCAGLLLIAVSAAWSGPFERVPAIDPIYQDLAVVRASGLTDGALVRYERGEELTRAELAVLWKAAYDKLRRLVQSAGPAAREPHPEVVQVSASMQRLLRALRPDLQRIEVDPEEALRLLAQAPSRVTSLRAGRSVSLSPPAEASPDSPMFDQPVAVGLFQRRTRAALPAMRLGPVEAAVGLGQVRFFEHRADGSPDFLRGHVLSADLRLRMGDDSVLLDYARSMGDRVGVQYGPDAARAFRASYEHRFNDNLTVDVGFRRLSRSYALLDGFGAPGGPGLTGVEAGVDWRGESVGLRSRGTLYLPETGSGWANRFGAQMDWRVADRWQLSLGYQSDYRRRLSNLEDAWRQSLSWGVAYGRDARVRAQLNYRYDSLPDGSTSNTPPEHTVGASLGMGF